MLDHLTLHVKDIDRSITFYKQALAPLGYPDSTCKCNGWFRVGLF